MKAENYRKLTDPELNKKLEELNLELIKSYGMMEVAKFKEKKGGKKRGGHNLTKRLKREIAKAKTIQNERRRKIKRKD